MKTTFGGYWRKQAEARREWQAPMAKQAQEAREAPKTEKFGEWGVAGFFRFPAAQEGAR